MIWKKFTICMLIIYFSGICDAKYEDQKNSFQNQNQWRRTYKENDTNAAPTGYNDRSERLGFSTGYGNGVQGYPYSGSGVGVYSPLKIDLGGIVVGAIIGIGALLIVPKLVGVLQGGYGGAGNYRSADDTDPTGITDMLSKLDNFLSQNNVDSTLCLQRAVCSYVRSSEYHMTMGTADQSDQLVHAMSRNGLVEYMLDGTAIKQALDNGKNMESGDCGTIYAGCPMDKQTVMQMLTKLLPKNSQ